MRYPRLIVFVICAAAALGVTGAPSAQTLEANEYWLDNGMQVLIVERHETPTFMAAIAARVGSANETTGITGISHLFEHMMFKGTTTIGTKDIDRDQEIMAQLDAQRGEMRREEAIMREKLRRGEITDMLDQSAKTDHYIKLEGQFDQLVQEQRELIIKDQLDEIYTKNGGSFLNAMTSSDMTMYMVRLPSNKLELFMWMESDRFLNPVFREFYSERNVVREERRLSLESTPTGLIEEEFASMFWKSSSYHWEVLGWASDLYSITREQAQNYYDTYYAPNNLSMILVGDLDPDKTIKLIRKYFERLPRCPEDPPEVVTLEEKQFGEKRLIAKAETNPQTEVWYHTVAWKHPDSYALDLLGSIMSGKTGRLYKTLVEEKGLAKGSTGGRGGMRGGGGGVGVSAGQDSRKYAGAFQISAEGVSSTRAAQLETAIYDVLEDLKTNLVPEDELQKVKNQLQVRNIRFMDMMAGMGVLFMLAPNAAMGDWEEANNGTTKQLEVTSEDIRRVAQKYFADEQKNVLLIDSKEDGTGGGQSAANPMIAQMEQRIKAMTNPEEVEQMIGMISSGLDSVEDPDRKASMEMMIQIASDHLKTLKKDAK